MKRGFAVPEKQNDRVRGTAAYIKKGCYRMGNENLQDVESLLGQIEDILEESKATIGGKIKVDKDAILEVINEIRFNLPAEFTQARKIANDRKDIINRANQKAEDIIAEANAEATRLAEETELTKRAKAAAADIISQAKAQSDDMIAHARSEAQTITENAEKWSGDMRASAVDFVDSIMNDSDEILSTAMDEMSKSVKDIRAAREQIRRTLSKN